MKRERLVLWLRALNLAGAADRIAGALAAHNAREANSRYRAEHPGRAFPDPRLIYEVQSYAELATFDQTGLDCARTIAGVLAGHGLAKGAAVLDWGCGPCRVLTHMRAALDDPAAQLHGCDPMRAGVAWAAKTFPDFALLHVSRDPPLPYPAQSLDALYGLSVFTHLGEADAQAWTGELARVLKPGGMALVTTHGEATASRLEPAERRKFDDGRYVTLAGAPRGSRAFAAYINSQAGERLFTPHFKTATLLPALIGLQDGWLLSGPLPRLA